LEGGAEPHQRLEASASGALQFIKLEPANTPMKKELYLGLDVHGKEVILRACYEAGRCGFGLARGLRQLGVE
jgi:hypothetical protein